MKGRAMNNSKLTTFIKRAIFTFTILISLALIFNVQIRNYIMQWQTNNYSVANVTQEEIDENMKDETTFDFSAVRSISTEDVLKAQWDSQKLPVIGGISIPELKINLPIFKGLQNTALMYGAGTMKEDQEMGKGNYALASHHIFGVTGASEALFSPLDHAKVGMNIYITDKKDIYTYTITEATTVTPESVHVIEETPGKTEITLITCTDYNATNRIVVKGELKSKSEYNSPSASKEKQLFEGGYNQYNYNE